MEGAKLLLLAQLACTTFMTGLIWFVQIVHYPLFQHVGETSFSAYEAEHRKRTTLVVAPAMLGEALASVLFIGLHPISISLDESLVGASLVLLIWLSTAIFSVPSHDVLSKGFSTAAYMRLCRFNWIRTAAWTARSVLLLWWLNRALC